MNHLTSHMIVESSAEMGVSAPFINKSIDAMVTSETLYVFVLIKYSISMI